MRVFTDAICAVRSRRSSAMSCRMSRRIQSSAPTTATAAPMTSTFMTPILPDRSQEMSTRPVNGC